jgi:hypothetical protein
MTSVTRRSASRSVAPVLVLGRNQQEFLAIADSRQRAARNAEFGDQYTAQRRGALFRQNPAKEPTASVWPSIRNTSRRSRRKIRSIAVAMFSTFPYCEQEISAEPKVKLIDWMSIDGAIRRISGRRFNSRTVTRWSRRSFTRGAAPSLRSICAAEGVVACAAARVGNAAAMIRAAARMRRFNIVLLLRNPAGFQPHLTCREDGKSKMKR